MYKVNSTETVTETKTPESYNIEHIGTQNATEKKHMKRTLYKS